MAHRQPKGRPLDGRSARVVVSADQPSTTITIRIPTDLKAKVLEAMERERRSMTNFLLCAIEDRIAKGRADAEVLQRVLGG